MKTKAAKSIFPKQWQATSGRVFRWVSFSGPTHLERQRLLTRLLSFELPGEGGFTIPLIPDLAFVGFPPTFILFISSSQK